MKMLKKESSQRLERYIPFICYILDTEENNNKFKQLKYWIENKKHFKKDDLNSMEQSIITKYRNLFVEKNLPPWVNKIFENTIGEVENIDLCSDDDDDIVGDLELLKQDRDNELKTHSSEITSMGQLDTASRKLFKRRNDLSFQENDDKNYGSTFNTLNMSSVSIDECISFDTRNNDNRKTCVKNDNGKSIYMQPDNGFSSNAIEESLTTWNSGTISPLLQELLKKVNCRPASKNYILDLNQKKSQLHLQSPLYNHQFMKPDSCREHLLNYGKPPRNYSYSNYFPQPNMNDPRILKRIRDAEMYKHLTQSLSQPRTQPVTHMPQEVYQEPRNYGEYRRQKLKLQQEQLRKQQQNECQSARNEERRQNIPSIQSNRQIEKIDTVKKGTRELKRLEVTINGYTEFQDYVFANGKRTSSITARNAIANQLNDRESTHSNSSQTPPNKKVIMKRRASMDARSLISNQLSEMCENLCEPNSTITMPIKKNRIIKRRKTMDENYVVSYGENHKNNSATEQNKSKSSNCNQLEPRVILKKISNAEIQRLTQSTVHSNDCTQASKVLSTVLVPTGRFESVIAIQPNPTAKYKKPRKKNTDIHMNEFNTTYCILCKSKPHNLTNHFVQKHKTESYVSRLSIHQIDYLRENIIFAQKIDDTEYEVRCIFCDNQIKQNFLNLYNHFSTHTGEYAFQCSKCKLQKPYNCDIHSHKQHAKNCANASIEKLYTYRQNQMSILIYCCKICNFVQLNLANVDKHIKDHHGKQQWDPAVIEQYVIAAIQTVHTDCEVESEHVDNDQLEYVGDVVAGNKSSETRNTYFNPENIVVASENVQPDEMFNESRIYYSIDEFEDIKPDVGVWEIHDASDGLEKNIDHKIIQYKLIPTNVSYFGLFKCMVADCYYSTNYDSQFLRHIYDHENSETSLEGCAICAYCCKNFRTGKHLIKHIRETYEHAIFQCYYCCYRSCTPKSVEIHQLNTHSLSDTVVVKCAGKELLKDDRLSYMQKTKSKNVVQLNCKCCHFSCYAISTMINHAKTIHELILDENDFEKYACIYCETSVKSLGTLQQHVAFKHPNELIFGCERVLPESVKIDKAELLLLKDYGETVLAENIKNSNDLHYEYFRGINTKLDCEDIIQIHEEKVKGILTKLTATTGIPPDYLYTCPFSTCKGIFSEYNLWFRHMRKRHCSLVSTCPHKKYCNMSAEIDLEKFREHFRDHTRHLFLCFHCGKSFREKIYVLEHFTNQHKLLIGKPRIEKIRYNMSYYYSVIISEDLQLDRLTFLSEFYNILAERLVFLQNESSQRIISSWIVPLTALFLEKFPSYFVPNDLKKKCIERNCYFTTKNIDDLFKHFHTDHKFQSQLYSCIRCDFSAKLDDSCNVIRTHLKMHSSDLHICCVCLYYHFDEKEVSLHYEQFHDNSCVPIIHLKRSAFTTVFSISIVYSSQTKSFPTLQECFICNHGVKNSFDFDKHLKSSHNLKPRYTCAHCDIKYPNLDHFNHHFSNEHSNFVYKIRCEICTLNNISLCIETIKPFKLRIENNSERILINKLELPIKEEIMYYSDNV